MIPLKRVTPAERGVFYDPATGRIKRISANAARLQAAYGAQLAAAGFPSATITGGRGKYRTRRQLLMTLRRRPRRYYGRGLYGGRGAYDIGFGGGMAAGQLGDTSEYTGCGDYSDWWYKNMPWVLPHVGINLTGDKWDVKLGGAAGFGHNMVGGHVGLTTGAPPPPHRG